MKNKLKSMGCIGLFSILVLSLLVVGISAFGVGCVYTNENPLRLSPGESSEVVLNLQSDKDIQMKASVIAGKDIAKFLDSSEVYNVPNGWVNAKLKVNIPTNAIVGQEYVITMSFSPVLDSQAGTVGLSTAIEKSFKVVVVEKPAVAEKESNISMIWWVLGILIILIVIALIWIVAKNKKEETPAKGKK